MIKVARVLVDILKKNKVKYVFEYPGGAVAHILDEIAKDSEIENITFRHEQAASFAADAYARESGNIGVCMATSGPGATNLITGIANAYLDSVPIIAITGQVNVSDMLNGHPSRQMGFQEIDIVSMCESITKKAITVTDPEELPRILQELINIAMSGRKGPVLIDIPMNVQAAMIADDYKNAVADENLVSLDIFIDIPSELEQVLLTAKKPVIFVGGGTQNISTEITEFASKTQIPLVYSMNGKGVYSDKNINNYGMIGWVGSKAANWILQNSDLILALGVRFDVRQTGNLVEEFAPNAKIVHVDIDKSELNKRIKSEISLNMDVRYVVDYLCKLSGKILIEKSWIDSCKNKKENLFYDKEYGNSLPYLIMQRINEYSANTIVTTDVGQNQVWGSQLYDAVSSESFITSAGLGAMGYGLPAAIGAYYAFPEKTILNLTGDGSFQMNLQELSVLVEKNIPVKILVFNNSCLGLVRQFQETAFAKRYTSTVDGYCCPNIENIAHAYGLDFYECSNGDDLDVIDEFMKSDNAAVCNVFLDMNCPVSPMLMGNVTIDKQTSFKEM